MQIVYIISPLIYWKSAESKGGVVNTSVGNANLMADALGIELKELFDFT